MKKLAVATFIIGVVLIYGCGESAATFGKLQPENIESLAFFPKHLRGKYVADHQAFTITISDKLITRHY